MYLVTHDPCYVFETAQVYPIECPTCPRGMEHGANDWQDADIASLDIHSKLVCNKCDTAVSLFFFDKDYEHLSTKLNYEKCDHPLCQQKHAKWLKIQNR